MSLVSPEMHSAAEPCPEKGAQVITGGEKQLRLVLHVLLVHLAGGWVAVCALGSPVVVGHLVVLDCQTVSCRQACKVEDSSRNAAFAAAKEGDVGTLRSLLLGGGLDPNCKEVCKLECTFCTSLKRCATEDAECLCHTLWSDFDFAGWSKALCLNGHHTNLLRALLRAGADIEAKVGSVSFVVITDCILHIE